MTSIVKLHRTIMLRHTIPLTMASSCPHHLLRLVNENVEFLLALQTMYFLLSWCIELLNEDSDSLMRLKFSTTVVIS
jgi:hypothetical protein